MFEEMKKLKPLKNGKTCEFKTLFDEKDDFVIRTSCGFLFEYTEGVSYCPRCGKRLVEAKDDKEQR